MLRPTQRQTEVIVPLSGTQCAIDTVNCYNDILVRLWVSLSLAAFFDNESGHRMRFCFVNNDAVYVSGSGLEYARDGIVVLCNRYTYDLCKTAR